MKKAKDSEFFRIHIFLNGMEVIKAIKGAEDWAIRNFVEETLDVSCSFKKINNFFIPKKLNGPTHYLANHGSKSG